jgi:parallel beta-helix repeat protein
MKTKVLCLLALASFILASIYVNEVEMNVKAGSSTRIVHDDFPTIQEAINAADSGATVSIRAGTYHENIAINKSISLIGESKETTIIDGRGLGNVVEVTEDNATITGFTIRNSQKYWPYSGIVLNHVKNCSISENNVIDTYFGITLSDSSSNNLSGNSIAANGHGIWLDSSSANGITRNNITNNSGKGILLTSSNNNTISRNDVANNTAGIFLISSSNNNTIFENNITNNTTGIYIYQSSNTNIFGNNFIENQKNAYTYESYGDWDDGYPSGGNYWSDYLGTDLSSGVYQNLTSSDGIGDTPYIIDANNRDLYPLMGSASTFYVGTWNHREYDVTIVSNSTVSSLTFNLEEKMIGFNVTNASSTTSFYRVEIPNFLLGGPYTIWVGTTLVTPSIVSDGKSSFLYFTYAYTSQDVKIIGTTAVPEFAQSIILALFMVLTLIAVAFKKCGPLKFAK